MDYETFRGQFKAYHDELLNPATPRNRVHAVCALCGMLDDEYPSFVQRFYGEFKKPENGTIAV